MQDIRCLVCGRARTGNGGAALACPSCGAAMPARPSDDAATRLAVPLSHAVHGHDNPPTQPLPPNTPTHIGDTATYHAAEPPLTSTPASARRRPSAVAGVALLVVVLLAVTGVAVLATTGAIRLPGEGAASTTPAGGLARATVTPRAGSPAGFVRYADPAGQFELDVPAGWQRSITLTHATTTGVRLFVFSDTANGRLLEVETVRGTGASLAALDDQVLGVAATAGGVRVTQQVNGQQVRIGGAAWSRETADMVAAATDAGIHIVVQATAHGDTTYTIISYLAPTSRFTQADVAYFQPMLASFTFGSDAG